MWTDANVAGIWKIQDQKRRLFAVQFVAAKARLQRWVVVLERARSPKRRSMSLATQTPSLFLPQTLPKHTQVSCPKCLASRFPGEKGSCARCDKMTTRFGTKTILPLSENRDEFSCSLKLPQAVLV